MQKLIFFDIDGTLLTQTGEMPDSTLHALEKLKENGHLLFLCSGRSKGEMPKNIISLEFDGMVASAGAYVEYNNVVLLHQPIKKQHLLQLINFLEKESIDIILETNEGAFLTNEAYNNFLFILDNYPFGSEEAKNEYLGIFHIIDNIKSIENVNKIVYFNSKYTVEELKAFLGTNFTFLPSSIYWCKDNSGEVSENGVHKAYGIEILLSKLSKTKKDVIAIGDGMNDIEMITMADIGIAMGNSEDQLKRIADYTTDNVDKDGVFNIFKKLRLI